MSDEQKMVSTPQNCILHGHTLERLEKLVDVIQTDVRSICVEQGRMMEKLNNMETMSNSLTDHEVRIRNLESSSSTRTGARGAVKYIFEGLILVAGTVIGLAIAWFKGA